jgi:serum/glucocorticoid-regulated kinase 2
VTYADGLSLPKGTPVPPAVQAALASAQAKLAAAVSPSSVTQQRLAHKSRGARDSIQRTGCWWLPYLVMDFDVNQVVITPLGGDLAKPVYMYYAHLCVSSYATPI